jgi:hypothetical protein
MLELNYKSEIQIDPDNLEEEWINQPSLYLKYSEEYANAVANKDRAKSNLEVVYAKIDARVRVDWDECGFDSKPTEPAIKQYISKNAEYRKAVKKHVMAIREANLMAGVKHSFDHRRKALENLVQLHISGFHSEPRIKKVREKRKARKKSLNRKRE